MVKNIGNLDKIIRIALGAILVLLPFLTAMTSPLMKWGAIIVGIVLLATALMNFCPAYRILGIRTCKV